MEQYKPDTMGIYNSVFKVWENSTDKESVEKTFHLLTGMEFETVFTTLGKLKRK